MYLYLHLCYYLYLYLFVCLSINLSIDRPFFLFIYIYIYLSLSIYLSNYLSIYLSIYLSVYLSIDLSIDLSIYPLSIYLRIYLPIYQSIHLSIYLSSCLSVNLSICLSVSLPTELSFYLYLSICLSTFLCMRISVKIVHVSVHLSRRSGIELLIHLLNLFLILSFCALFVLFSYWVLLPLLVIALSFRSAAAGRDLPQAPDHDGGSQESEGMSSSFCGVGVEGPFTHLTWSFWVHSPITTGHFQEYSAAKQAPGRESDGSPKEGLPDSMLLGTGYYPSVYLSSSLGRWS